MLLAYQEISPQEEKGHFLILLDYEVKNRNRVNKISQFLTEQDKYDTRPYGSILLECLCVWAKVWGRWYRQGSWLLCPRVWRCWMGLDVWVRWQRIHWNDVNALFSVDAVIHVIPICFCFGDYFSNELWACLILSLLLSQNQSWQCSGNPGCRVCKPRFAGQVPYPLYCLSSPCDSILNLPLRLRER